MSGVMTVEPIASRVGPRRPGSPGVVLSAALLAAASLLGGFAPEGRGLALATTARAAEASRPVLYVYLHTESKSAMLERALQDEMRAVAVTAFGRFRDFEEAMADRPPDAVMTLGALLSALDVPLVLQGLRANSDSEAYVLISPDTPLEGPLSGKSVGVVDLLGRNGTQDFVAKLLDTPDIKLKRVTKTEDLLPLLQFSAVDAVLVASASVKGIRERSRLRLEVRELPARVALPAVGGVKGKGHEQLLRQIQALGPATNRILGVDRWRAR